MKKRHNNSTRASTLQITISIALISVSAVLLTLAASPAGNRVNRQRSDTDLSLSRVPADLKPVERQAWLAMAQRESIDAPTAANSWTNTGSLSTARTSHTATLLPNGKVLVAGGLNGGSY